MSPGNENRGLMESEDLTLEHVAKSEKNDWELAMALQVALVTM